MGSTSQLHSPLVSASSDGLMTVVSRNQLIENAGLRSGDTCLQVRVVLPPSGIISGMPGPTGGSIMNSVVQKQRERWSGGGGERERERERPRYYIQSCLQHLIHNLKL